MKCKKQTEDKDVTMTISKNGRHMKRAICAECGTKKCLFVKKPESNYLNSVDIKE